jgi:hypothetical protein
LKFLKNPPQYLKICGAGNEKIYPQYTKNLGLEIKNPKKLKTRERVRN